MFNHAKTFILLIITGISLSCIAPNDAFLVNPTGTHQLVAKTSRKGGDVYGYAGEINVKVLSKDNIIMSFSATKGAPSYNMGSFVDTLEGI